MPEFYGTNDNNTMRMPSLDELRRIKVCFDSINDRVNAGFRDAVKTLTCPCGARGVWDQENQRIIVCKCVWWKLLASTEYQQTLGAPDPLLGVRIDVREPGWNALNT